MQVINVNAGRKLESTGGVHKKAHERSFMWLRLCQKISSQGWGGTRFFQQSGCDRGMIRHAFNRHESDAKKDFVHRIGTTLVTRLFQRLYGDAIQPDWA